MPPTVGSDRTARLNATAVSCSGAAESLRVVGAKLSMRHVFIALKLAGATIVPKSPCTMMLDDAREPTERQVIARGGNSPSR